MSIIKNINLYSLFLFSITFSILMPKFNSIDSMSVRWLLLSIINFTFYVFNFLKKDVIKNILNWTSILLFTLFLISLISSIYSSNHIESILSSFKIFTIFFTIYNLSICLVNYKKSQSIILILILISLCVESLYVIISYLINRADVINGISMNPNISSFSILLKLPIIIYYQIKDSRNLNKLYFLEILVILSLIILESRGALSSLFIIYLLLFFYKTNINRFKLFSTLRISIASLILLFNNKILNIFNTNQYTEIGLINDQSLLLREDYYRVAFNSIKENVFLGRGSGSWKVESLGDYFSLSLNDSIIPYYVHNDFIQFFYELGIIGFIIYIFFFISFFKKSKNNDFSIYDKLFFLSLLIFLIDSNLNFPFHRPQEIISLLLISSPTIIKRVNIIRFPKKIIFVSIVLISSISIFLNTKEHKSLVAQDVLISDLFSGNVSLGLNDINEIDTSLPNLSSNTIPLSTYKSYYLLEYENFESALTHAEAGYSLNPYLRFTKEIYLKALLLNNDIEKSLEISRKLYYQDTQNKIYALNYIDLLILNSKLIELEDLFDSMLKNNNEELIERLLLNYSAMNIKNINFLNDALSKSLSKFPENKFIQDLSKNYLK